MEDLPNELPSNCDVYAEPTLEELECRITNYGFIIYTQVRMTKLPVDPFRCLRIQQGIAWREFYQAQAC